MFIHCPARARGLFPRLCSSQQCCLQRCFRVVTLQYVPGVEVQVYEIMLESSQGATPILPLQRVVCSSLTDDENSNGSRNGTGAFSWGRNETGPSPHTIHTTPGSSRTQMPKAEKEKSDNEYFPNMGREGFLKTPKAQTIN